ncbi:hypothetical protein ACLB1E_08075 [Escherichia coli]
MTRRVVITGMGGVTAFGENWQDVSARLLAYENAVRKIRGVAGLRRAAHPVGTLLMISRYRSTTPASVSVRWAACRKCRPYPRWR